MKRENPCNVCKMREKDDCDGCALDVKNFWAEQCCNDKCFLNTNAGCNLLFDRVCKASTAYNPEPLEFEEGGN